MMRLENITKENDTIKANLYVEDSETPIWCEYQIKSKQFKHDSLPDKYEWCTVHFGYAKRAIESMITAKEFPETKTVMWC